MLVTMRLFLGAVSLVLAWWNFSQGCLERIIDGDPVARVVGLFGVYVFYYTQPDSAAPKLRRVNHIPIPIGVSYEFKEGCN